MSIKLRIIGEKVESILQDVATGKNALPIFQRGYVWKNANVQKLADSLIKGIPLGNMFLWDTEQILHTINYQDVGIETYSQPTTQQYIIDGGQRSITIFGLAHGGKIGTVNFDNLYIDGRGNLADLVDGDISVYTKQNIKAYDPDNAKWYVPFKYYFWKPLNRSELELFRKEKERFNEHKYKDRHYFMQDAYHTYIEKQTDLTEEERMVIKESFPMIHQRLLNREISITKITSGNLQDVLNLFERTNQEGLTLQEVEIMNAVLYNPDTGFYYTDELGKLAKDIEEDIQFKYTSNGKNPFNDMNTLIKYMVFGTYNNADIYKGKQLFDANLIKDNWTRIIRALYNGAYEVGYDKNTPKNLLYRNVPLMIWASFFYHNNNVVQTKEQQVSIDQFIKRLLGTSYFENGGLPQRTRTLTQYINEIANNKHSITNLTPDLIEGTSSAYLTANDIIEQAYDVKKPDDMFNRRFFYMQEINGNYNIFTGSKIEGSAQDLEICHIFPKNTHKEVSNNVFNYIRQPKSVNDSMGHGEPLAWIDRVDRKALTKLFIDDTCIQHIRNNDLNKFIHRRAALFHQFYTK